MTSLEERTLEELDILEIQTLPKLLGSENEHLRGIRRKSSLFIKVYAKESHARRELAALNQLDDIPGTWVEAHGLLADGRRWIAMLWKSLRPFHVTKSNGSIIEWASILSTVHSRLDISDDFLPRSQSIYEDIDGRLAKMDEVIGSPISERTRRVWEATREPSAELCKRVECESGPASLLHGDFGQRNTFWEEETDRLVLIDFERASLGLPYSDFAKAWDNELGDSSLREDFFRAYRRARQIESPNWPDERYMWIVRLWATAGIFPYAQRVNDRPFFRWGLQLLERLVKEQPKLDWSGEPPALMSHQSWSSQG